MILVEADNDLAQCVEEYFSDRYDVVRVSTLGDAVKGLADREVSLLFADVDLSRPGQSSVVDALHRDHPHLTIVLTYLTPAAGESWEARLRASADVLVRKPYSVLEVDDAIRKSGKDTRGKPKRR